VEAENEVEDLPTCDLMRSRKLHTQLLKQLLKGRSDHAIPLAHESFKQRLPTPFFFFMIGHLLLTTFWQHCVKIKNYQRRKVLSCGRTCRRLLMVVFSLLLRKGECR
jgi:hypothetical protein